MTLGRSLGPMKISARIATTASSVESTPNIADLYRLTARVVAGRRWRSGGLGRTRGHVDRVLVARQARRLLAALLVIALALLILIVGHALLEAFEALGDVAHHRREPVAAEQQQQDDREDQDMPNAETAHEKLLWRAF